MKPAGPCFHRAEHCVLPVPLSTCHRLEALYHYAKGGSKAGKGYGLFRRNDTLTCLGVAHYNVPQREAGNKAWSAGWREVWTLHRLVVVPGVPTNAASYLIAASAKMIARDTGCRCLLSYADTWQGHEGRIYRAANWEYCGLVRGDSTWIDPTTGRMVAQRRGNRTFTDAEMRERGYVCEGYHPKHKYRLVLPERRAQMRMLFREAI